MMIRLWIFALAVVLTALPAQAEINLELNKIEPVQQKCRTYLVVEELAGEKLASLKADFIVFGKDGAIARRIAAELGPVRAKKTTVKVFDLELACTEISGL